MVGWDGWAGLAIRDVALVVAVLYQLVVAAQAGADAAVVFAVVVGAAGLALAAPAVHAADTPARAEGREAALAGGHAGPHWRVYALGALSPPGLGPVERLEVCFVLGGDGPAVLERRHLLAGLVDIGVVVL